MSIAAREGFSYCGSSTRINAGAGLTRVGANFAGAKPRNDQGFQERGKAG
jgi:hypothetical protein